MGLVMMGLFGGGTGRGAALRCKILLARSHNQPGARGARPRRTDRSRNRRVPTTGGREHNGRLGTADQEVPEPAALRHQDVELHHARRRQADGAEARGLPGHRREVERGPHAADPAADHPRGGVGRRADVLRRPAVADHPLLRQRDAGHHGHLPREEHRRPSMEIQKTIQEQSRQLYGDNPPRRTGAVGAVPARSRARRCRA